MSDDDSTPTVACTLTPEQAAQRPPEVLSTLAEHYLGAEERLDGVTVRFSGTADALVAAARFVSNELECCAFTDYCIEVSPPYEETHLTITGPEGTREMFGEGLVGQLESRG